MPRERKRRVDSLEPEELAEEADEYSRWLRAHGVVWSGRRLRTTTDGVVAGWGCVATAQIKRGEELVRIPRAACLGAEAAEADADVQDNEKDSQRRMALVLGRASASDEWAPFVRKLTRASCPWLWPEAEQQRLFKGTELGPVLAMKRKALAEEHAALPPDTAYSLEEYVELCGLAASHLNPWFGGCIAPFNTTLNYSSEPNVGFEPKGADFVVGVALRKISAGEELTQEYADATTDLIYKYGFAPRLAPTDCSPIGRGEDGAQPETLEDDVVSISLEELVRCVHAACPSLADSYAGMTSSSSSVGHSLALGADRVTALVRAGAVEPCPWDGLGNQLTLELSPDGGGTARLVGAAIVLCAPEDKWRAAAAELETLTAAATQVGSDAQSKRSTSEDARVGDDDLVAATLLGSLAGVSPEERKALTELAASEGGEDGDPWPSLVTAILAGEKGEKRFPAAWVAAKEAIGRRRAQLEEGARGAGEPNDCKIEGAWKLASHLRQLERSILTSADEAIVDGLLG